MLKVKEIKIKKLPANIRYKVALAANEMTVSDHARMNDRAPSEINMTISGKKTSRPVLKIIEDDFGIPVGDWDKVLG